MARVAVVGGGLTSSHLAVALRQLGHPVTLVSSRSPQLVRESAARPAYLLFGRGRAHHRILGLEPTATAAPDIESVSVHVPAWDGAAPTRWSGSLRTPARAMDPRVLQAYAVESAVRLGAELRVHTADSATLDELHGSHDLVVTVGGSGGPEGRASDEPPPGTGHRVELATYVSGVAPAPDSPTDELSCAIVPGAGELYIVPAATAAGSCHFVLLRVIPDGAFDLDRDDTGHAVLPTIRQAIRAMLPQELQHLSDASPLDDGLGLVSGWTSPAHRPDGEPPGARPSWGRPALAINSAAGAPPFGLEANRAVLAATTCAELVNEHDGTFDESWVRRTTERVEQEVGHAATWRQVLHSDAPAPMRALIADALRSPTAQVPSARSEHCRM